MGVSCALLHLGTRYDWLPAPSRVDRKTRERAVEMHAAGRSIRDIARALKVPRSTIGRAIMAARVEGKRGLAEVPVQGQPAPQ